MSAPAVVLLLVCAGAGAVYAAKPDTSKLIAQPVEVTARPIESFGPAAAGSGRIGKLTFRGGLILTSPSPYFGGLSGLAVSPNGTELVAVSDSGSWLTAHLDYRGDTLSGIGRARIGPMRALDGKPLTRRRDRDAEAIAIETGGPGNGVALVAFENNRRIGRFPLGSGGLGTPSSYLTLPRDVRALGGNKSLESVAALAGGRHRGAIVAFAERTGNGEGDHTGWLIRGKGAEMLRLEGIGGYDLSDVAALPDGGLIVLERRFRWTEGVHMRLRRLKADEIAPGKRVRGEVLLEAGGSLPIDNMEGVAVHQDTTGAIVLTLVSDDNFSFLQRTMLLQFAITQ